jgi:hypothetical protein
MELKAFVQNKICAARRIEYILGTGAFNQAFDSATEEEKKEVIDIVHNLNDTSLKDWLEKKRDLAYMPVRQLRMVAIRLGIPDVWTYDKGHLLSLIKGKEKPC